MASRWRDPAGAPGAARILNEKTQRPEALNSSKSPSIWGKKKEPADPAGGGPLPRLAIIEDDELSARLLADQACQFGFDPFVWRN